MNDNIVKPQPGNVYVALDIGSNSFHLIVARIVDNSLQILHKVKQRVRLAKGLDSNGILDEESILRGLDTLSQMAQTLEDIPADNARVVATYTLRVARNANEFITRAQSVFPYPIEVVSGQEEARLIYQGVAHTVSSQGQRLIIDIGGGSTEFIIGEKFEPKKLSSRSMGCVSFTNQFFAKGTITERNFQKAIIQAELELEEIIEPYKKLGWETCFGTSGTIKAIREAIVKSGWSHGTIEAKHLEQLKQMLIGFSHVNEIDIVGVSEHRAPVLPGGLAILIASFELFNIESITYSDAALREGVLYEMEERLKHHDIRERTVNSLITRYDIDQQQSERVKQTALEIWHCVKNDWRINTSKYKNLLLWACQLHEIGLHIHSSSFHRHSAYIITHSDLPGFNQEEQIFIASLLRFQRKKLRLEELPSFTLFKISRVVRLVRIMRLAVMINLRRRDNQHIDFTTTIENEKLILTFLNNTLENETLLVEDLNHEIKFQLDAGFELLIQ